MKNKLLTDFLFIIIDFFILSKNYNLYKLTNTVTNNNKQKYQKKE